MEGEEGHVESHNQADVRVGDRVGSESWAEEAGTGRTLVEVVVAVDSRRMAAGEAAGNHRRRRVGEKADLAGSRRRRWVEEGRSYCPGIGVAADRNGLSSVLGIPTCQVGVGKKRYRFEGLLAIDSC